MGLFRRHHHHHHHHRQRYNNNNQRLNWNRDKKMILGIIFGTLTVLFICLVPGRQFVKETFNLIVIWLRPETEYDEEIMIDPIRTNWQLKQQRELQGDSVATAVGADTLRKEIRQKAIPVYRPPRPRTQWYLTGKDMQELRRGAEDRMNKDE